MSDTKANDMAFPSTFHNGWGEPEKGMTLRDYFAAKAMQALIHKNYFDVTAKMAYQMADEMLKVGQ